MKRLTFLDLDVIEAKLAAMPEAATFARLLDAARAVHASAPQKRGVRPLPFSATFPGAVHRVLVDEAATVTLSAAEIVERGDLMRPFSWTVAQVLLDREDPDAMYIAGSAYLERAEARRGKLVPPAEGRFEIGPPMTPEEREDLRD